MTPQEFFKKDRFADNVGVELIEIKEGYGKARLVITEEHLNAGNRTQGGALFTLADLALAAAANSHGTLAFSLSSNITFLRSSGPGDTLYAEARERYAGRIIRPFVVISSIRCAHHPGTLAIANIGVNRSSGIRSIR